MKKLIILLVILSLVVTAYAAPDTKEDSTSSICCIQHFTVYSYRIVRFIATETDATCYLIISSGAGISCVR